MKPIIKIIRNVLIIPTLIIGFLIPPPAVWEKLTVTPNTNKPTISMFTTTNNRLSFNDGSINQSYKSLTQDFTSLSSEIQASIPDQPLGKTLTELYDGLSYDQSSMTLSITDPNGQQSEIRFNNQDLPVETIDALGNKTTAEYDDSNNVSAITDGNNIITRYVYDDAGNLISSYVEKPLAKNDKSKKLSWLERLMSKVIANEDPTEEVINLSYNTQGNLETIANESGEVKYQYDEYGDPIQTVNTDKSTIEYEYDEYGNIIGKKITQPIVENDQGLITKLFRNFSARAEEELPSQEQKFSYDADNNPLTVAVTVPVIEELSPDQDSEKLSFWQKLLKDQPRARAAGNVSISVANQYDPLGSIIESKNTAGIITNYSYDDEGRPTSINISNSSGKTIFQADYELDQLDNWKKVSNNSNQVFEYTYDEKNQLNEAKENDRTINYNYDANGNRLSKTDESGVTNYQYQANRVVKTTYPDGSIAAYEYDNNGNMIAKTESSGTSYFSYTTDNYLEKITLSDGQTIKYTYDGLKRRISRQFNESIIYYSYEGQNMVAEKDANGQVITQYIYDPNGKLLAMVVANQVYYFMRDNHRNVVGLTDESGNVVESYSYDSWGKPLVNDSKNFTPMSPFLYSSYDYEPMAGLYILGPRAYDPELGRFYSQDPISGNLDEELTRNEYIYGLNNPVNYIDPNGHFSFKVNLGNVWNQAKKIAEEMAKKAAEALKKAAEATKKALEEAKKKADDAKRKADEAAKKLQEATKKAWEEAKRQAEEAQRRIEDNARRAKEALEASRKAAEEMARKAAEEISRRLADAKQWAEETSKKVAEEAKKIAEETAQRTRDAAEAMRRIAGETIQKTEQAAIALKQSAQTTANNIKSTAKQVAQGAKELGSRLVADINQKTNRTPVPQTANQSVANNSISRSNTSINSIISAPILRSPAIQSQPIKSTIVASAQNQRKQLEAAINKIVQLRAPSTNISNNQQPVISLVPVKSSRSTTSNINVTNPSLPSANSITSIIRGNVPSISKNVVELNSGNNGQMARYAGSATLGFVPIAGDGYDLISALTGHDYITNDDLVLWERLVSGVAVFVPFVAGSQIRAVKNGSKIVKLELQGQDAIKDAEKLAKRLDEISKSAKFTKSQKELVERMMSKIPKDASKLEWTEYLTKHFYDHRDEVSKVMGRSINNEQDYLNAAKEFIGRKDVKKMIYKHNGEMDRIGYVTEVNGKVMFAATNAEGKISTFYPPTNGWEYFKDQKTFSDLIKLDNF